MAEKIIPTKLENVFNTSGNKFSFDVNTPQFIKEACENSEKGMYAICWNIFQQLLAKVAERATELNDPVLNALMIRLNLYEIPYKERYKILRMLEKEYNNNKAE